MGFLRFLILSLLIGIEAWAYTPAQKEYTFLAGPVLPSAISDFDRVTTLWGGRYGFRTQDGYFYEAGLLYNELEGRNFMNASFSLRGETDVDPFITFYSLGADLTRFKGEEGSQSIVPGVDVAGGLEIPVTETLWLRTEAKFNFSPGNSLFLGFGLTYRPTGSASSSGAKKK